MLRVRVREPLNADSLFLFLFPSLSLSLSFPLSLFAVTLLAHSYSKVILNHIHEILGPGSDPFLFLFSFLSLSLSSLFLLSSLSFFQVK